ncbi:MAG: PAS domain S-box protein [Pirellulales bacterium]|nr:PAS domain S-box protein [Pirellulales bacterium]
MGRTHQRTYSARRWTRPAWLAVGLLALSALLLALIARDELGGAALARGDGAASAWMLALLGVAFAALALAVARESWALHRRVDQQTRVEEALRESEEKYRVLFSRSADGTLILEGDRFIECNDAAVKMFGCDSRDQLLRTHPWEVSPETQSDGRASHDKANEMIAIALREGTHRFEWDHRRVHGEVFPVEVLLTAIPVGGGHVLYSILRDITERKRIERDRERLIQKLEAQNAELERFTYTVSHDLKSPLITINGYLGILRDDVARGDAGAIQEDMRRMGAAADKMVGLLGDLLELSRIGRLVGVSRPVPLAELVREAVELVGGQIAQRGVEIVVGEDPPILFGDRPRLLEVVQNLIDNAVKYAGDQAAPRIEIGCRPSPEGPVCYVRDNGVGIEPAYFEKVFGLFEQLDPTLEGTGIGLALVKRIVEVHGGRIWVESEGLGKGATFCFRLPLAPAQGADAARDAKHAEPEDATTAAS